MTESDVATTVARLERRNGFLWLAVIALCIAVGFLLVDYGYERLGLKVIRCRQLLVEHRNGSVRIDDFAIAMHSKEHDTISLELRADGMQLHDWSAVNTDALVGNDWYDPPGARAIELKLLDEEDKSLPRIEIKGPKGGFPRTSIGSGRLGVESPEGKKTEIEYPASSIIFFDEKGHSKAILP